MADSGLTYPSPQKKTPSSFLFGFTVFASKSLSDSEVVMSPTSILDTKPFSALKNPFWTESNSPKSSPKDPSFDTKPRNGCPKFDTEGVGLGIIDSLTDDAESAKEIAKKPENSRLLLFGSQLKIQIPTPQANFLVDSPNSPMEFGTKTKNSHLGLLSPPTCVVKCSNLGPETPGSPWSLNGSISTAEMELSEDYTCVISRGGPVTKTTRIFDDCVVDSCFGTAASPFAAKDQNMVYVSPDVPIGYPSEGFLSFCHTCRKNLDHGKDIYMYRGEKAFCSDECRCQGMLMEEMQERNHGSSGVGGFASW